MTIVRSVRTERIFMGRLARGSDLLGELMDICAREKARLGRVEVIGSVTRAQLGYYHQEAKEYRGLTLNDPLEIVSLVGNISIKDGAPFVHAHITLSNERGMTFGGHLSAGTVVFAAEFVIEAFEGPAFEREYDADTGLHLWGSVTEAT